MTVATTTTSTSQLTHGDIELRGAARGQVERFDQLLADRETDVMALLHSWYNRVYLRRDGAVLEREILDTDTDGGLDGQGKRRVRETVRSIITSGENVADVDSGDRLHTAAGTVLKIHRVGSDVSDTGGIHALVSHTEEGMLAHKRDPMHLGLIRKQLDRNPEVRIVGERTREYSELEGVDY